MNLSTFAKINGLTVEVEQLQQGQGYSASIYWHGAGVDLTEYLGACRHSEFLRARGNTRHAAKAALVEQMRGRTLGAINLFDERMPAVSVPRDMTVR